MRKKKPPVNRKCEICWAIQNHTYMCDNYLHFECRQHVNKIWRYKRKLASCRNTLITAIAKPKLYAGECPLHWIPQKQKKKNNHGKKRYHTKRQKCKHSWRINFNVSHFGHNSEPINQNKSPIQCRIASKLCTFTACTYLHCATATHFS